MTYLRLKSLIPDSSDSSMAFDELLGEFPSLELAKGTPQDSYYHGEGDVWTHTKMVVSEVIKQSAFEEGTDQERFILFYAALLHDIAKHSTTKIDEASGKITQPGHSKKGAIDARIALWKKGVPFEIREQICRIIAHHQIPFYLVSGTDYLRQLHRISWGMSIKLLTTVARADIKGRICPDAEKVLLSIDLMDEIAKEEGCFDTGLPFSNEHSRLNYARHNKGLPEFNLYQETGSLVTIMCGIPAAGKNTWVSKNLPNLPVVSFDDAKEALGLKHGKNDGKAAHYAVDLAKSLLRKKESFVWNATHLSSQMRDKSLDLLYDYNANVSLVYVESSYQEVLRRNSERNTTLTNKELEGLLHRWEVPYPWEAHLVSYVVDN